MVKLARDKTQILLRGVEESFTHDLCPSCECFLAYLAQLRVDADPAENDLFIPFKVERTAMHKCLGCNPCPPADQYADYMLKKQKPMTP